MAFDEVLEPGATEALASVAVPRYYEAYEKKFDLRVYRPLKVEKVYRREDRFFIDTPKTLFSALGIINATGTWENPYIPEYPVRRVGE